MLEKKLYPNKELAPLIGVDIDDTAHLKRNITKVLEFIGLKQNKDFKFPKNGHTLIIRPPETPIEKIHCASCKLKFGTKIDVVKFATFIYCLYEKEEFNKCPWVIRQQLFKDKYSLDISEKTLYNWKNKIIENNLAVKDNSDYCWWSTDTDNTTKEKIRKKVEEDSEEYQKLKAFIENFNNREDIQKMTEEERMKEYRYSMIAELGKYYYKCASYKFNAWENPTLQFLVKAVKEYLKE